jgi:cobalt-precorrin 5A hydrolase/precorrin-3B C17-methyltransferase
VDLILGLGCARGCDAEEMWGLVVGTLEAAGLAPAAIAAVGTLDLKADEPAVIETARRLGVPLRLFGAAALEAEAGRLANPSEVVFAEVGCHGVAEGAALALAGADGALAVAKRKSANATCAVARAPGAVLTLAGRPRGRVSLVGIGPGAAEWRTPEASRLIAEADELVGYGLYIDLLGPLAAGKPRRDFPLGGEEARCRYALERAGEGVDVALVCSGDAGIYAMGALVFELLDRGPEANGVSDAARRVEVISAPGVSALQAAAARAGAPLGHDFCAISLSDLLTPRADILRRIRAAAEGDFVIAFYNPVSRRRRTLLAEAREMLLKHRPAECPVLLASNLGRPEEAVRYRRLDALEVDEVDMLTVVLVGSSQSRLADLGEGKRMYTPRGYAKRIDAERDAG